MDSLANALSKILNQDKASKRICWIRPGSKIVKEILTILNAHQFVGEFKEISDTKGTYLKLNLLGNINKCGIIKPHFNVKKDGFEKFEMRYLPARNIGIIIVSTPQGIMTHTEAKSKGIGGKILAYCY